MLAHQKHFTMMQNNFDKKATKKQEKQWLIRSHDVVIGNRVC
jgi:hypothetical protein